jgi:hypothetical protein
VLPVSLLKRTVVSPSLCSYLTRKRSRFVTSQELKKQVACVRSNDIVVSGKTGCPKSPQRLLGHTCSLKRASLQTHVNMSCHVVNVRRSRKLATLTDRVPWVRTGWNICSDGPSVYSKIKTNERKFKMQIPQTVLLDLRLCLSCSVLNRTQPLRNLFPPPGKEVPSTNGLYFIGLLY